MADEDAGAQSGSAPAVGGPRRRTLLWTGLGVLLVVALGVGAVLLLGDSDDKVSKVAVADEGVATTLTPTTATTSHATSGSNTPAGTGASGGGTTSTSHQNTTATTAPTATTATTATTKPTATTAPPTFVAFTSAYATPAVVSCDTGTFPEVTISWTTRNATSVRFNGHPAPPNSSVTYGTTCGGTFRSLQLVATGPGGTATVTVSWTFDITNPPANN